MAPMIPAITIIAAVGIGVKHARRKDAAKRIPPNRSMIPFLAIETTVLNISAHTMIRIPAKACTTVGRWIKLCRMEAIRQMMMMEGDTTPRVAAILPGNPACFYPT